MLSSIGYGGITSRNAFLSLLNIYKKETKILETTVGDTTAKALELLNTEQKRKKASLKGILVKGESSLDVHLAKCCSPVPGDKIIGYITRGRGVTIHRVDCSNLSHMQDIERLVDANWEQQTVGTFQVMISVVSYDRNGFMTDVLATLSDMKTSVSAANVQVNDNGITHMKLGIQIRDLQQLEFIMTKIRRIKGVHSVERLQGKRGTKL
jgi:GTP diphosphokinase